MKEAVSALNSDVLRPLVSLFVPGAIASVPPVVAIVWVNPWLKDILIAARTEATVGR